MFLKINNLALDDNIQKFCMDYVQNNEYDRAYDNHNLLEYYPLRETFIRNFNFADICIGKITTGKITPHVDDSRDSVLIIPFNELTIITDNKHTFNSPFLLNTTLIHGADSFPNSVFIGIDFHKTIDEAKDYLNSIDKLFLGVL